MYHQKCHYDEELSGQTLCGLTTHDLASEDLKQVTCKNCLKKAKYKWHRNFIGVKMEEETTREVREKIWKHDLDDNKIWGKTYLKVIVADTETQTWTYDEERVQAEVDKDGHLCIQDDRQWIYIHGKKALEIIREAIDIAIKKQNEAV